MLIVEYLSKSYDRVLNDMSQIANHKSRFLLVFNGASSSELNAAVSDLTSVSGKKVQHSAAVIDKASDANVANLFSSARTSRDILLFEKADVLFEKKGAVKNAHQRETTFNLNNLFKNIANHNGVVVLATETTQTLSASMSSKVDVLIRFPSV